MTYTRDTATDFMPALRARVDAYFDDHQRSRKGNFEAHLKVVLAFGVAIFAYVTMLTAGIPGWGRVAMAMLFGVASAALILCVGHDASHGSLFERRWLNRLFAFSFNLVGSDATGWALTHDRIHHTFPNVGGIDGDIQRPAPFLRLSPTVPWRPWHRYQHRYAPFLYLNMTLFAVTLRDFKDLRVLPNKNAVPGLDVKHPPWAVPLMIASKLFYFSYTLLVPWLVLDVPFWQILLTFVGAHYVLGLLLAVGLVPAHNVEATLAMKAPPDGVIRDDFARHAVAAAVDYGADQRLFTAFFGGLNIHVIHHLFPGICHVHYPALLPILRATCEEYGVDYRHHSLGAALRSHLRMLRRNGDPAWGEGPAGVPLPPGLPSRA